MKKLLLTLVVCVLPGSAAAGLTPAASAPPVAAFSLVEHTPQLSSSTARRLGAMRTSAQSYRAATGETVEVSVSSSYAGSESDSIGQQWADFFAGLLHGDELRLLHVSIAPLSEVRSLCGGGALGCYGDNELVMTGETAGGFEPEEIARHEYGHHVAFNRANPPWKPLEWGPKRWASDAGVCARTRAGTAYPGDQSLLYRMNPGEAFAESYRLVHDMRAGTVNPLWPIVDRSFYPDAGALRAVEEDVVAPWGWDSATVVRRGFRGTTGRAAALRVATPLDGTLVVRLRPVASYDVSVVSGGEPLRATGHASTVRETRVTYQICGQRSLAIGVAPSAVPHFELEVTRP